MFLFLGLNVMVVHKKIVANHHSTIEMDVYIHTVIRSLIAIDTVDEIFVL